MIPVTIAGVLARPSAAPNPLFRLGSHTDPFRLCPPIRQIRAFRWFRPSRGASGQAAATREFWISDCGSPLSRIYESVTRATKQKFGKSISPHFFRHCFATTVAVKDPDHVGIIAPVLTHRDPQTGEIYYNLSRNHDAARRWQANILELRR